MFYERLQELCNKNNIKLTPLLKKLNLSSGNISKWQNNVLPNSDTLLKFSQYFSVSIDYLLCETDDPTPANKKELFRSEKTQYLLDKLKQAGLELDHLTDDDIDRMVNFWFAGKEFLVANYKEKFNK